MSRASNEAEVGRPTVEQEMAVFKGFSTENGETITKDKPEDLNPVAGKNQTAAEIAAAAKTGDKAPAAKTEAAKEPAKLTDAEHDKVITELDAKLGREATEAEVTKALADATNTKNGSGKTKAEQKSSDRYRAMQRERNEARRQAAALETRLAALEATKNTPATDPAKQAVTEGAPDPKKFEYGELDAGYIRALARWEAKQEIAAEKEAGKTVALTEQQKAAKLAFDTARDAFEDAGSELYDDFSEVVIEGARSKEWPLSDALGSALLDSEFGPQIAYELASDTKEAKRIFGLSATRQVTWLGRKEAELESAGSGAKGEGKEKGAKAAAEAKPEPKAAAQVSKAPTPIQRARGQGSASAVPGDTQDFAAFEAAAMARTTR